jgi:hypothetical protein
VVGWWHWHDLLAAWRPDPDELRHAAAVATAGALLYGSVLAAVGSWIGTGNVRRLLRPR